MRYIAALSLALLVLLFPVSGAFAQAPAGAPTPDVLVDEDPIPGPSKPVPVVAVADPAPTVAPMVPVTGTSADAGATDATSKVAPVTLTPPVPEPKDIPEAMKDVGLLIDAARNGNWVLFSGILILLIIFVLDKVVKLKSIIPKTAVPWVAAGFGIVISIAMQLTTGIPWGQALVQGFCSGTVAVGLWEMLFNKKPVPPGPSA